jgi:hypothetical protein
MERPSLELKSKFSLPGERREASEIVAATGIEEEDLEIEGAVAIRAETMTIDPVGPEPASTVVRRAT